MIEVLKAIIEQDLDSEFINHRALAGGSINEVYLCQTGKRDVVIKINHKDRYPNMFRLEAEGLVLLHSSAFRIPEVIHQGNFDTWSYIVMEYIDAKGRTIDQGEFGEKLAKLHLKSNASFGLESDNYIGSLPQINKQEPTWTDFYASCRLNTLLRLAFDKHLLDRSTMHSFESLYGKIQDIVPDEPPSLIHGDLWQGNLLCDEHAGPVLIDPAVYYGHREMDLAMLQLFGRISEDALNSYNQLYPLEKNWIYRVDFHQLYPLMVHLILFGESYLESVKKIVQKYS